jgi:diaminobutyrate-2-oxoglutarate transaminase
MIQGLHCRDPFLARRILDCAFAGGMIMETCGANKDVLKLLPPLVIEEAELDEGLSILGAVVDEAIIGAGRRSTD